VSSREYVLPAEAFDEVVVQFLMLREGLKMPLSRRSLWIGAALAAVAVVIVVLAIVSSGGGGGGVGY
jgi:hypothetical protein